MAGRSPSPLPELKHYPHESLVALTRWDRIEDLARSEVFDRLAHPPDV
jgi:hypothetical protein